MPGQTVTSGIGWLGWAALAVRYRLPSRRLEQVCSPESAVEPGEPITEDACMAPYRDNLPHDDLGAVLRIARSLRPRLMFEIGTAHGNLTANLLKTCDGARMITVNAPADEMTGEITTFSLKPDEIGRVYRKYGMASRVEQLFINSLDLDADALGLSNCVDLAIVDGCHDTDFVINDFRKIQGAVRPGGIVLMHDTHPSQQGHLKGSYRACLVLRKHGEDIRWIRGTWWGYWRKPGAAEAE